MLRRVLTSLLLLLAPAPLAGLVLLPTHAASQETPAATVRAQSGMVVSASAIASEVGDRVLREGGNAVDAAIATGLALAVTHPTAGNIGGGGFMVIRFPDGRSTAIDFREKAPLAAHAEMFVGPDGEYSSQIHHRSHLAVGVPGTVAGFALAHGKYGRAEWSDLVEPAVDLAADGFALSPSLAGSLERVVGGSMQEYPASVQAFSKNGVPYAAGEIWTQPDLARTLARIRDEGHDGFYRGETARLLAAEMERGGGWITEEDLARYEAQEREPIRGTYRGYEIISMPPPSSGGIALVEMLNILEGFDLKAMGHNSADYVHHLTEAMRRAYRDRAQHVADTDFVDVPIERLTSKEYAAELRSTIDPNRATPSDPNDVDNTPAESRETTHYSVVDGDGMAVSVTYTLEQGYGSKITVPGAGFLLNNEMGDFNPRPGLTTEQGLIGTSPNLARPEQRMLSSMTPSILVRDGQVAVIGSPGGRTIINTVLQVALNIMEHGMGIQEAVNAPRFHHQWLPNRISFEEDGIPPEVVQELQRRGHEVRLGGGQGTAHSVMIDAATGERVGAPDRRGDDAGAAGH